MLGTNKIRKKKNCLNLLRRKFVVANLISLKYLPILNYQPEPEALKIQAKIGQR